MKRISEATEMSNKRSGILLHSGEGISVISNHPTLIEISFQIHNPKLDRFF